MNLGGFQLVKPETINGASANIAGLGILRKEGHEVSVGKFMSISVPFTLVAVTCGYLLVWLIWA